VHLIYSFTIQAIFKTAMPAGQGTYKLNRPVRKLLALKLPKIVVEMQGLPD
jgi:hypothetical protein